MEVRQVGICYMEVRQMDLCYMEVTQVGKHEGETDG